MKKIKLNTKDLIEIWKVTRPNIFKNKKKYSRKSKHKNEL